MNEARLSPDGHAVAFTSRVGGIAQVFLILTSGGEPLQLTNGEGDKDVNTFSPDGKEIYYARPRGRDEVWAVPTLGGAPRRVASSSHVVPSPDGASISYVRSGSSGIFRAGKSGLNEELVYNSEGTGLDFFPLLLFPGGNDLLAAAFPKMFRPKFRLYRINVTSHEAPDLGEVSGNRDVVWDEPGKTVLFSRTVNGLTNIWNYSLNGRSLTHICHTGRKLVLVPKLPVTTKSGTTTESGQLVSGGVGIFVHTPATSATWNLLCPGQQKHRICDP